ncbi:MAG: type II toxin-antitoxin system RelE/ParE family toxin [Thermotogota bacterium]|nr:type II toxin-antitoxin system RelE/ParE family toxin [Thermotogota bacterium]
MERDIISPMKMKRIKYHPEAKNEIQEAIKWYNRKTDGLGLEFVFEVKQAEVIILQDPEVWPFYVYETRRYLLKRFPFAIVYLVSQDEIQIIAVAHCKRKPAYWAARL